MSVLNRIRSSKLAPALDVWMSGCTGCLDVWMPVTWPSARPSCFHSNCCSIAWKETCCCSRSSITESWRMGFPTSLGGFGNRVNLRSLNPALFVKSVTWTKYQLKIDYMPCHIKVKSLVLSKSLLHSISIWWWGCIFESICTTYCICITIPLLKHKALGKLLVLTLQTSFGHPLLGKNGSSTSPKSSCVHRWNQTHASQESPSLHKDLHQHGARVQAGHVTSHVPTHLLPLQHPSMP